MAHEEAIKATETILAINALLHGYTVLDNAPNGSSSGELKVSRKTKACYTRMNEKKALLVRGFLNQVNASPLQDWTPMLAHWRCLVKGSVFVASEGNPI